MPGHPARRRAAGTAEVSSQWLFRHHALRRRIPQPGRKIQKLLELPPIPAPSKTASQDAKRSTSRRMPAKKLAEDRHPPVRATRCRVFREHSSSSFRRSRLPFGCMAGCHAQHKEAPGGSPGTPGVNIIPLAMLMRPDAATLPCIENGLRRHAESPGFRRGLLPDTMPCFA